MLPKQEYKYTTNFYNCKFFVSNLGDMTLNLLSLQSIQWGCFGFDSIRHWTVSTPGSVGQPVNLDLQTISWQQLLCTRCVVCKAHYLNPRRQGCVADEYPSSL